MAARKSLKRNDFGTRRMMRNGRIQASYVVSLMRNRHSEFRQQVIGN